MRPGIPSLILDCLLTLACGFPEGVCQFHFRGVAAVLAIGSTAIAREIISLRADRVTAKYREELGGLCLEVHGISPSPARWKMLSNAAIMKCEKSQCETKLLECAMLTLNRASKSRPSGIWSDDAYDVFDGE